MKKIYFILIIILASIQTSKLFSKDEVNKENNENTEAYEDLDDFPGEKKDRFKFSGYYKNLFIHFNTDRYIGSNPATVTKKRLITDINRIRLSPEFIYSDLLFIHIDYDNETISSNYKKSYEFKNSWQREGYNDLLSPVWEPWDNKNTLYRTKLHRAYSKITLKNITLTMGRQQIRFGSGRLWNPLDILNPISPVFVESAEEQKGTDAIKADIYFSDFTELTLIYDQKRRNNSYSDMTYKTSNRIGRFKMTIATTDIAILAGRINERRAAGSDFSKSILGGILRGSLLHSKYKDGESFITANSGYEYTFKSGLYFLAEYFYNQQGLNFNAKLKNAFEGSLITGIDQSNYNLLTNQIITYNKHYAGLALGYDLHPLLRFNLFSIYDFQGKGLFLNGQLKYNVKQNTDLEASIFTGHVFANGDKTSDFEEYKNKAMLIASLVVYF